MKWLENDELKDTYLRIGLIAALIFENAVRNGKKSENVYPSLRIDKSSTREVRDKSICIHEEKNISCPDYFFGRSGTGRCKIHSLLSRQAFT